MKKKYNSDLFGKYDPSRVPRKTRSNFTARYVGIAAVFLIICLFYIIKIIDIQAEGVAGSYDDNGHVTRTYTVAGVRGEIYDRNGVLLVGNELSYDVLFEYGSIPETSTELNRAILDSLEAIELTDAEGCISEDLYVLEGVYPNLRFKKELYDKSSEYYKAFERVVDANNLKRSEITPEVLYKKLQVKYKIYEDYYSDEEITALLRVRYEMERVQFGYYNSYTLAENVPMELVSYIEESGIDGVNFKISAERVYNYPGYASHILGRVGKIQESELDYYTELGYSMDALVGNSGCEKAFEGFLHSQDGVLSVEYDESGSVVDKHYEVEPISGNDVWLTIDINMQIAAEDSLRDTIANLQYANAGSAVSLEANSGAVLAIASYPTYDLTQFESVDYYSSLQNDEALPLLNRALNGAYAPGSVYKIGAALAALEEGNITESSTYTCNRVFPHLHKPTCLGNHGEITVADAIKDSCNVFFYYLGMEMGSDAMTKYTRPLGLGVATGIELSESTGTVGGAAAATDWGAGSNLSAAIGQANHAYTPLQMALYTATLTNGGTRYTAHLLHSVRQFYTGKVILNYEKQVAETVEISDTNKDIVLEGMRRVVAASSLISPKFKNVPVTVGGKTGTAQVTGKVDYALFTGAAPYNDPEVIGFCVIEEGAVGGYASAPVAKMFEAYYSHK